MTKALTKTTYTKLITDMSAIYEHARQVLVEAYWEIGKRIVEIEQNNANRAEYGAEILQRLSADLTQKYGEGFSLANLKKMRKFYVLHQKSSAPNQLSWTGYAELLFVSDNKKRIALERKAVKNKLSTREIRTLVQGTKDKRPETKEARGAEQLTVTRGALGTYGRVDAAEVSCPKGRVIVDCGFGVLRCVSKDDVPKKIPEVSYTYAAVVHDIIDGDTVKVTITGMFDTLVKQKLRFRGINTPEIDTPEGKSAERFVRNVLKDCPIIVIQSHKVDKYARYLADIFYLSGCTDGNTILRDGTYLNQELLDKGLAERWRE